MKSIVLSFFAASLLCTNVSHAYSVYPSGVTDLEVDGVFYDVSIGDGVVGELYSGVTFNDEYEVLANAVSDALLSVLIAEDLDAQYFDGCSFSNLHCEVFNADSVFIRDENRLVDYDMITMLNEAGVPYWGERVGSALVPALDFDSSKYASLTMVTFARSNVPEPSTITLLGLGLLGLLLRRKKA